MPPLAAIWLITILLVVQVVVPAAFVYGVWRGRDETRGLWWVRVAYAGAFVFFVFFTGRWDWLGAYWRMVLAAVFVAAVVVGYRRARRLPWRINGRLGTPATAAGAVFALLVVLVLDTLVVRAFLYDEAPIHLRSPLRNGVYYVVQGGNSTLVNYHNPHPAQQFALDIVQLNAAQTRVWPPYSADPTRYVIFGAALHSPCNGTVVTAVDGLPDQPPPQRDAANPAGNHVTIDCSGTHVELAHLQNGSVTTWPGQRVVVGDGLGRVGNSGNTSEPHLHIHATRTGTDEHDGDAVPILIDGVFAVRNSTIRR